MSNAFYKVDDSIIAKLSFPRELCNYVLYSETHGRTRGYLYKTDEATYEKIKSILVGKEEYQIKKKDRVYLMPGNPLPAKRIKEYLRTLGAYITNDISKATVIAGNSDYYNDYVDNQALLSEIQFSTSQYYKVTQNSDDIDEFEDVFTEIASKSDADDIMQDWYNGIQCFTSLKIAENIGFHYNLDRLKEDTYFLQPVVLEILFYVLSKKLPILSENYFIENANSGLDLADPVAVKGIMDMLNSNDNSNRELAKETLLHAKFDMENVECVYNLWKLSNEHYHFIDSGTSKNVSSFVSNTGLRELYYKNTEEFLTYLLKQDILNKKIFMELFPEIIDNQEHMKFSHSKFFELTHKGPTGFVFRLKNEWLNILKDESNTRKISETEKLL